MSMMIGRRDWVQADLRCLMCGRVIGRLVGPAPSPAQRSVGPGRPRFAAFRPIDASLPAVRLAGDEQFRCTTCGGGVMLDELETFSTYPDVPDDAEQVRPKRGRPPKPWRRTTSVSSWLDQLNVAG